MVAMALRSNTQAFEIQGNSGFVFPQDQSDAEAKLGVVVNSYGPGFSGAHLQFPAVSALWLSSKMGEQRSRGYCQLEAAAGRLGE